MNEVLSKELLIYYGSTSGATTIIGRANSYTLTTNKGTIDTTSLETSGYSSFVADLKDFSIDAESVYVWNSIISGETKVSGLKILQDMLNDDNPVWLILKPSSANKEYFYAQFLCKSWTLNGATGDVLKVSMSFQGTGTLFIGTTS